MVCGICGKNHDHTINYEKDKTEFICDKCYKIIGEAYAEQNGLMNEDQAIDYARENHEPMYNEGYL